MAALSRRRPGPARRPGASGQASSLSPLRRGVRPFLVIETIRRPHGRGYGCPVREHARPRDDVMLPCACCPAPSARHAGRRVLRAGVLHRAVPAPSAGSFPVAARLLSRRVSVFFAALVRPGLFAVPPPPGMPGPGTKKAGASRAPALVVSVRRAPYLLVLRKFLARAASGELGYFLMSSFMRALAAAFWFILLKQMPCFRYAPGARELLANLVMTVS